MDKVLVDGGSRFTEGLGDGTSYIVWCGGVDGGLCDELVDQVFDLCLGVGLFLKGVGMALGDVLLSVTLHTQSCGGAVAVTSAAHPLLASSALMSKFGHVCMTPRTYLTHLDFL